MQEKLRAALDKAAYALFQVKRMVGVTDAIREHCASAHEEACAVLDESPVGLTWTAEKPTTPGWYWWKGHFGSPALVEFMGGDSFSRVDNRNSVIIDDGEWAGPIAPPEG